MASLEVISRLAESNLVKNDDVVALIFLNGKLFTAINTRDNKGIIKTWTPDFKLLYEFVAHEYPIYHMTNGEGDHFFTSAADCTISHWVDDNENGSCKRIATLTSTEEPAWRLRYDTSAHRLYSGDSTGQVRMWENDELVGCLGTVEEIFDMQIDNGVLFTTRNLDVYLTALRTTSDDRVTWSIKNTIEGSGPLLIMDKKIVLVSRRDYKVLVHCLEQVGNPRLGMLEGHEAIITALVGYHDTSLNSYIIFSADYIGTVIVWNLTSYQKLGEVKLQGYVNSLAVDINEKTVFAGGQDRFICAMKLMV